MLAPTRRLPWCPGAAGGRTTMSKDHEPEKIEHQHVEEKIDPQARAFMFFAGALMVAAIMFGVLNTLHVFHM